MSLTTIASLLILAPSQATADIRAGRALIDESAANIRKVESLTFTLLLKQDSRSTEFKVKILRGGYASSSTDLGVTMIWTPKTYLMLFPRLKQYREESASPGTGVANPGETMPGFEAIVGAKPLVALGAPVQFQIGDKQALSVQVEGSNATETNYVLFDSKTKLPLGSKTVGIDSVSNFGYEDLNLRARLRPSDFEWSPPSGWKELPH